MKIRVGKHESTNSAGARTDRLTIVDSGNGALVKLGGGVNLLMGRDLREDDSMRIMSSLVQTGLEFQKAFTAINNPTSVLAEGDPFPHVFNEFFNREFGTTVFVTGFGLFLFNRRCTG
jgi:hypothetical protein